MINLDALLERFKKSLGKDVLAKESVLSVILEATGIRLEPEDVSVKEGVLTVISTPGKNNAIKLKEPRILSEIRARTGQNVSKIFYK